MVYLDFSRDAVLQMSQVQLKHADLFNISNRSSSSYSLRTIFADKERPSVRSDFQPCEMNGWPVSVDRNSSITPFHSRRNQMSIASGCLFWGMRVVIPPNLRESYAGIAARPLGYCQNEVSS